MSEQSDIELKLLVDKCCKLLSKNKKTIAFSESATGGFLAYSFSTSHYAGEVLKGGIVCYDTEMKKRLLKIPAKAMNTFIPESPEITKLIAEGMRELIKADYYIGVTGLLRSGGSENPAKPLGTVFTYLASADGKTLADRALFRGSEEYIVKQILENVCRLLMYMLR